ncbi:hypothetical protein [Campylobacter sp. RM12651]|uniref:hypothetical protein n=1 Tax=Campylobacter sp. RM12651 TaxID=1660079 RepID=UPI001EFB77F5|nr:hypothetical protein [Campylobacter sp. RM12651]
MKSKLLLLLFLQALLFSAGTGGSGILPVIGGTTGNPFGNLNSLEESNEWMWAGILGAFTACTTIIPFILSFFHGIYKERTHHNQDFSMVGVMVRSIAWHFLACIVTMFFIEALHFTVGSDGFIQIKSIKEMLIMFWSQQPYSAGANGASDTLAYVFFMIAYLFYNIFWIACVAFAGLYSYRSAKVKADASIASIGISTFIGCLLGYLIYIAWENTTELATYMNISGVSIKENFIHHFWTTYATVKN